MRMSLIDIHESDAQNFLPSLEQPAKMGRFGPIAMAFLAKNIF
jgi:hypothetical protein